MPSAYQKTNGDYSWVELDWRNDSTASEISGAVYDLLCRLDYRAGISDPQVGRTDWPAFLYVAFRFALYA